MLLALALVGSVCSLAVGFLAGRRWGAVQSAHTLVRYALPEGPAESPIYTMYRDHAVRGQRRPRRRKLGTSGTLTVELADGHAARSMVEGILREEAHRLELDEVQPGPTGTVQVRYVVGFPRDREPEAVLSSLLSRARPHVLGVIWH